MNTEILIGLGGLILSVLTYFAGVHRTERRLLKKERDNRIRTVFNRYMEFRESNYTGGLDGLKKAGIATLTTNEEIYELFELITKHGERHPLSNDKEVIEKVGLKKFFDYAIEHGVDFLRIPVGEIIREIESKK